MNVSSLQTPGGSSIFGSQSIFHFSQKKTLSPLIAFASSFTGESGDRENVAHYKVAISGPDSRSLLEFSTKLAKLLNEAELFDEPLLQSDVMSRPALELIPIKNFDIELTKRIIRFCLGGVRLGRLEKDGF